MFGNKKRQEIAKIARELKRDAKIAGTFPVKGEGDEQTVAYEVIKYTPSMGFVRGLLFQVTKGGEKLEIISAHEQGEPINAGSYEHQRDLAIRYARQEGVGFGELDADLANQVLGERRKI